MKLQLTRPIACIDLETTGTSITQDRIVEISIIKLYPDGRREAKTRRVNPGVSIPAEATAIHGISNEDVANEPSFKSLANGINQFLADCDLCGYNSNKFDIPLLTEEFLRCGMPIDFRDRHLVDVQAIYFKKEPRNLSAALKYYCQRDMENAHSAEADAMATIDILLVQLDRYEDLTPTVSALDEYTKGEDFMDYSRRIKRVNNVPVFNFGKYKDKSVLEVLRHEPQYYDWIMKGDFALDTKNVLTRLKEEVDLRK